MFDMDKRVEITAFYGTNEVQEVLGYCWAPDPHAPGKLRRVWGLADKDGVTLSSMSYLWEPERGNTPAGLLSDLDAVGKTQFYFHAGGAGLWCTVDELRRAFHALDMLPPALSTEHREGLSHILRSALTSYGVCEDRSAHVMAEFESCVDGWVGGSYTPPS